MINEKVIELGIKSCLLNYIDNETPKRYFINGHADLEEVQDFAHLIIKECLSILESDSNNWVEEESFENLDILKRKLSKQFGNNFQ